MKGRPRLSVQTTNCRRSACIVALRSEYWRPCHRKGLSDVRTGEQYRAKAAEFRALLTNIPRSPNETSEFRNLEQTYTTLAENEEWMAINIDKTI